MQTIESVQELEALYDTAIPASLEKVLPQLSALYKQWIEASRFLILSTVGTKGTDASPRGDSECVVKVVNPSTLWLPDWRGNNRLDSLRNIVQDGRASLVFMVPGSNNVVRVNGTALLTAETSITAQFERKGKNPRSVIVLTINEVYFQCAKALMRSRLWKSDDESEFVPTAGQFISDFDSGIDQNSYDDGYEENAKDRMW